MFLLSHVWGHAHRAVGLRRKQRFESEKFCLSDTICGQCQLRQVIMMYCFCSMTKITKNCGCPGKEIRSGDRDLWQV